VHPHQVHAFRARVMGHALQNTRGAHRARVVPREGGGASAMFTEPDDATLDATASGSLLGGHGARVVPRGLRIHHIYQSCEPSYRVLAESSAEKARFRSFCGRVIPMLSFVLVLGPQSPKNRAHRGCSGDLMNDQPTWDSEGTASKERTQCWRHRRTQLHQAVALRSARSSSCPT
jgi:hypothetical protein